jgi:serine/threonine protein kinase
MARGFGATDREEEHLAACADCREELAACRADEAFLESRLRPTLAESAEPPATPLFFGPYTHCVPIGRGGMASVYSATAPDGSTVAVKVCHQADAVPYFRREIRTMVRAYEAHVVGIPPLLAAAEAHIPAYLVTRLFTGGSLAERLARDGRLPVPHLRALAARLAGTLDGLSRLDIVHRDIKPSNILFDAAGEAWLADLGLAREYSERVSQEDRLSSLCLTLTRAGSPPVTVAYMSPEQAAGERLTPASDVFALGITLYEAATGRHPFAGKTIHQIAAGIQRDRPPSPAAGAPDLPTDVSELILACLEKDPRRRPAAAEIARRCKESPATANSSVEASKPLAADSPRATEGTPMKLASMLASAVALGALITLAFVRYHSAREVPVATSGEVRQQAPSGPRQITPEGSGGAGGTIREGSGWGQVVVGALAEDLVKELPKDAYQIRRPPQEKGEKGTSPAQDCNILLSEQHLDCLVRSGVIVEIRFSQGFAGATARGIRIGSTKEKLLAAYGEPSQSTPTTMAEKLEYAKAGVLFWVTQGKVNQIVVFGAYDDPFTTKVSLTKPYPESSKDAGTEKISLQSAVAELARQARLGYDFEASFANTDPICRKWVTPQIAGMTLREALDKVLTAEGLTYEVRDGKIVLKKQQGA